MSAVILGVEGLGKMYRIRHQSAERYVALRDVIASKVSNAFRLRRAAQSRAQSVEEFWALKDVSFEVGEGEVIGIIGRNGAGKSTLLKVLSRITEPTEGRVSLKGRVASLLEVGTGFHPELTGRENIFLNGAILGMTRSEIKRKFDEIVAFAEVEKFLDTPVKRYSSGMYVRLAFAVAAHMEPEILIVDEVLAVGDAEFQRKCLGRMSSASRDEGRTVLFVSHNMVAVEALCKKTVHLRSGRVAGIGSTKDQVEDYLKEFSRGLSTTALRSRLLSPNLTLKSLAFSPNPVETGASVDFSLEIGALEPCRISELSILLYSGLGARVAIVDLRSASLERRVTPEEPLSLRGRIREIPLVEGDYLVGLFLNSREIRGDVYDLTRLSVLRGDAESDLMPYLPHDRGLVELRYDFARD
jgi:lipopolysaccharide transport system ATP-binding protein